MEDRFRLPDAQEDLEDWLSQDVSGGTADTETPDVPNSDLANLMLRRLRRLEQKKDEITALAAAEATRIESWRLDRLAKIGREQDWHKAGLERFMRSTGEKTLKLPEGELRLRPSAERIDVTDEKAFLEWVGDNHPNLIRVKVEADKTALKRLPTIGGIEEHLGGESTLEIGYLDEQTGEIDVVPGVVRVMQTDEEGKKALRFEVGL